MKKLLLYLLFSITLMPQLVSMDIDYNQANNNDDRYDSINVLNTLEDGTLALISLVNNDEESIKIVLQILKTREAIFDVLLYEQCAEEALLKNESNTKSKQQFEYPLYFAGTDCFDSIIITLIEHEKKLFNMCTPILQEALNKFDALAIEYGFNFGNVLLLLNARSKLLTIEVDYCTSLIRMFDYLERKSIDTALMNFSEEIYENYKRLKNCKDSHTPTTQDYFNHLGRLQSNVIFAVSSNSQYEKIEKRNNYFNNLIQLLENSSPEDAGMTLDNFKTLIETLKQLNDEHRDLSKSYLETINLSSAMLLNYIEIYTKLDSFYKAYNNLYSELFNLCSEKGEMPSQIFFMHSIMNNKHYKKITLPIFEFYCSVDIHCNYLTGDGVVVITYHTKEDNLYRYPVKQKATAYQKAINSISSNELLSRNFNQLSWIWLHNQLGITTHYGYDLVKEIIISPENKGIIPGYPIMPAMHCYLKNLKKIIQKPDITTPSSKKITTRNRGSRRRKNQRIQNQPMDIIIPIENPLIIPDTGPVANPDTELQKKKRVWKDASHLLYNLFNYDRIISGHHDDFIMIKQSLDPYRNEQMTTIIYTDYHNNEDQDFLEHLAIPSYKNDKFHKISSHIHNYLHHAHYVEGNNEHYIDVARELDITLRLDSSQFALILPATINHYAYYDAGNLTAHEIQNHYEPGLHHGAYVFIFDYENNHCTHACFHENKTSKKVNRSLYN